LFEPRSGLGNPLELSSNSPVRAAERRERHTDQRPAEGRSACIGLLDATFIYRRSKGTQRMWQIAITTKPPTQSPALSANGSKNAEPTMAARNGVAANIAV